MELALETREKLGKQVKYLRAEGRIPGELYGHGIENVHVAVQGKEFKKVFHEAGESTVITAVLGGEKRPVLIHEVARNPVTDEIINIDFYQVRLDEKIDVHVPIEFVGDSSAVREGGILVKSLQELEIEALPNNIPHSLQVDISVLTEIGKSLYVKDIALPEGVRALVDQETVVVNVGARMTEEEEKKLEGEGVGVEAVTVEGDEKKEVKAKEDTKETSKEETPPTS